MFKFLFGYKKSEHRSFEEICAAIDAGKGHIPSLTQGGYTQASEDGKKMEPAVHGGHAVTEQTPSESHP